MSAYQDLDNSITLGIAQDIRNPLLDFLMPAASDYITWIPVFLVLLGYCYWKNKTNTILLIISAVLAIVASELVVSQFLKELVMRVRPCNAFTDLSFIGSCTSSYSFPSSHAANSFVLFGVITYFFHRLWHLAVFGAIIVSFSRVYLGVHYISDVLGGAVIGIIIGFGVAAFIDITYTKQKDKNKKSVW